MNGHGEHESPYPQVPAQPGIPDIEAQVLDFWAQDDTFRASVEARDRGPSGENEFVFYDGPPFANGLPHYGHLLTGFMKDAVPRYRTMRGRRVERRFGWDCHGLPAEMEAVRELGLRARADITRLGVDRFNDYCRESVLRYRAEWEDYVRRQARWVDFANDYKTMDRSYMESVMWAFRRLWELGLVYEGTRVLPYCWECETPLSNFETRMDDTYRDRVDPSLTVLVRVDPPPGWDHPMDALVWTTTPWTLPANLALAVHPELTYDVLRTRDGTYQLVASARADRYERELGEARKVATLHGRELVGLHYRPLFDLFEDSPGAFRVVPANFVTVEEGTGIVHLAPGFGEEDHAVCADHDIPLVCPVDERGRFTDEVPALAGEQVFDANASIIAELTTRGRVLRAEEHTHPYPHCWRTDTPLIYRATRSWFVKVTAIKERLRELNRSITWIPSHVRDGAFGAWLEGARDWSVSRNRFWGSPVPVWVSDDPTHPRVDVYGSLDELERDFGVRPADLHRPGIDELTRPNPDDPAGRSTMRRVPEVLDCWFESGSMPFAQVHYPFENRRWFEDHFPGDFIVEYVGQTRGWFYTLHVLAGALFDRPAFRTCVVHGVLLGADGRQLSKRLRNYPDPMEVFDTEGADAMRWFLFSSPVLRGQELLVERQGVQEALRRVILPVWNVWHFLSLYANADGARPRWRADAPGLLDRYILAEAHGLVSDLRERMDAYDVGGACSAVRSFLETLTNWYVRRSRERFWRGGDDEDKRDAYDTLYTALEVLCRTAAPLLPLVTEAVYRDLTGTRSVHLQDFPEPGELPADPGLIARMRAARAVCSAALGIRRANGVRVRLPLESLRVTGSEAPMLEELAELISEEVNVKHVHLARDPGAQGRRSVRVNLSRVGPRLGPETSKVLDAVRRGDWRLLDVGRAEAGGHVLEAGEWEAVTEAADDATTRSVPEIDGHVALDTTPTAELEAEGVARDIIRLVQQARKEAGLRVDDRIRLVLEVPAGVEHVVGAHGEMIARETLATGVEIGRVPHGYEGRISGGRRVRAAVVARG